MYIAYYLHWPLAEILGLEHAMRHRIIAQLGMIHRQLDGSEPSVN